VTEIVCLDAARTAPLVGRLVLLAPRRRRPRGRRALDARAVRGGWLAVRPAWQGQGLGRRLFRRVLAGTAKRRAWLVAHDLDSPAMALYRSLGWQEIGRGPLGWHEAERVVLAAQLRPC
jgi:GNAT superfamily N-acetyltransferase